MQRIDDYLKQNEKRYVDELIELVRIPSVSAQRNQDPETRRACQYVADKLKAAGLDTEIIETAGQPLIYAQWLGAKGAPTVLIYGHYDVQPADDPPGDNPEAKWKTPPFEPTIKDGNLYARGSTDDKGQMYTHIKAVEAWMKTVGKLPINVKFLIEGEEEVGSKQISLFIPKNKDRLKCDVVVISDTSMFAPDVPAITYGLKGIAYYEVFLQGAVRDLHSGSFGGSVQNPANGLCELLASLKDKNGRIQLPGFYDDVIEPTAAERAAFAKLGFDEAAYRKELGVADLFGEKGYTAIERKWMRPTCDINGLSSGYQGEGAKTVLPARASAKLSFRLVPKQDPAKVTAAFREFIAKHKPVGVEMEIKEHHGAAAVVVPLDSPAMKAASKALEIAFGKPPVFIREGGSIPIVTDFKQHLGADSVLLGFGLPDDGPHGPNEKFRLLDYQRGIRTSAHLFEQLAKMSA